MDERALGNCGLDDRLDRGLLHVGHHVQHHLTSALDQAEDGWLVLLERAAARRAGQPATASEPPLFATATGWPLWPATTSTSSTSTSPASLTSGALAIRPRRNCSVMACTSEPESPSSEAICRLERFSPMK